MDCGGVCTRKCNSFQNCKVTSDCSSRNGCFNVLGVYGTCYQDECTSDMECPSGMTCNEHIGCIECIIDANCPTGSCVNKRCVSCTNGIEDGYETDVDCGGTCSNKCKPGQKCKVQSVCNAFVGFISFSRNFIQNPVFFFTCTEHSSRGSFPLDSSSTMNPSKALHTIL